MTPKAKKYPAEKRPAAKKTRIAEKSHAEHNAEDEKKLTKNNTAAVRDKKEEEIEEVQTVVCLVNPVELAKHVHKKSAY